MRSLEDLIIDLPANSSTLVEHRIKLSTVTLIVVKDDFRVLKTQIINPRVAIRGAFLKSKDVLAQYIVVNLREKGFNNYYKFWFDYNDEKCLKLLLNLIKQKYIYIILCDNNNNLVKEITLNNTMKNFFKQYIERCLKSECKWNKKQYAQMLQVLNNKFTDDYYLWRELGEDIINN
ncbi:hypothetical protein SDC9_77597 [bioreactor metagenome]|uniref:Uncharacterized protein n=1 Tax=bioreactor metagenome TaxID=1076179 RepID=A0A644YYJ5_9ZZZZ